LYCTGYDSDYKFRSSGTDFLKFEKYSYAGTAQCMLSAEAPFLHWTILCFTFVAFKEAATGSPVASQSDVLYNQLPSTPSTSSAPESQSNNGVQEKVGVARAVDVVAAPASAVSAVESLTGKSSSNGGAVLGNAEDYSNAKVQKHATPASSRSVGLQPSTAGSCESVALENVADASPGKMRL
jgi:hypothetical protein